MILSFPAPRHEKASWSELRESVRVPWLQVWMPAVWYFIKSWYACEKHFVFSDGFLTIKLKFCFVLIVFWVSSSSSFYALNQLCVQGCTKWPLKTSSNTVTHETCYNCSCRKNMHLWKSFFHSFSVLIVLCLFDCFFHLTLYVIVFQNCQCCWYQSRSLTVSNRN